VDGVFSADPRIVANAHRLSELSHEEMQELALAGAKVLNGPGGRVRRADRGIAIHARSTFQSGPGTLVKKSAGRELRIPRGRTTWTFWWCAAPNRAALHRGALEHGAWPREAWDAAAIVPLENVHGLPGLLDALRSVASVEEGLAQVSVVGTGIGASKDPLDRALRALGVEPRGVLVAPLRSAFATLERNCCVARVSSADGSRGHDQLLSTNSGGQTGARTSFRGLPRHRKAMRNGATSTPRGSTPKARKADRAGPSTPPIPVPTTLTCARPSSDRGHRPQRVEQSREPVDVLQRNDGSGVQASPARRRASRAPRGARPDWPPRTTRTSTSTATPEMRSSRPADFFTSVPGPALESAPRMDGDAPVARELYRLGVQHLGAGQRQFLHLFVR